MWKNLLKDADLFEKFAKAQPIYMYHGTAEDVLPSILSQGLITNPKQRAWAEDPDASFWMPSRQSLHSIYLTSNLLTALGSGGRRRNEKLARILLIVSVQPQSLDADEDSFIGLRAATPTHWSEFLVAMAYIEEMSGKSDGTVNDAAMKKDYVDTNLERIKDKLKQPLHPALATRLKVLLEKCYLPALARKAAYVDAGSWERAQYHLEVQNVEQPNKNKAEQEFKRCQDQVTRTLHILARPDEVNDLFDFTARSNTPIGFSGSNKIVAIFKEVPRPDSDFRKWLQLVYPDSVDQIPEEALNKLMQDWNQTVGPGLQILPRN